MQKKLQNQAIIIQDPTVCERIIKALVNEKLMNLLRCFERQKGKSLKKAGLTDHISV